MKTPEELERLAYITGDTRTADLLAQVIDLTEESNTLLIELESLESRT